MAHRCRVANETLFGGKMAAIEVLTRQTDSEESLAR